MGYISSQGLHSDFSKLRNYLMIRFIIYGAIWLKAIFKGQLVKNTGMINDLGEKRKMHL
jgi:hypothetical protein